MTAWGNVTMIDAAELAQLRADLAEAREKVAALLAEPPEPPAWADMDERLHWLNRRCARLEFHAEEHSVARQKATLAMNAAEARATKAVQDGRAALSAARNAALKEAAEVCEHEDTHLDVDAGCRGGCRDAILALIKEDGND